MPLLFALAHASACGVSMGENASGWVGNAGACTSAGCSSLACGPGASSGDLGTQSLAGFWSVVQASQALVFGQRMLLFPGMVFFDTRFSRREKNLPCC